MWDSIRTAILSEFSDLPDAGGVTRVIIRLTMAALLGGVLGWERERRGKSAGLRTHILVAMGSAVFVMVPQQMGTSEGDMTRVLQGLLAGIGFLGAGAIVKQGGGNPSDINPAGSESRHGKLSRHEANNVQGLTTAAGIWMTAAIGMSVGLGRELTAIVSTIFALAVLALLPRVDHKSEG